MPQKYGKYGDALPGFTKTTRKEDNAGWRKAKAHAAQKRMEGRGFVAVPAAYAEVARRGPRGGGNG